jgi:predicted nucleotidyltransferase
MARVRNSAHSRQEVLALLAAHHQDLARFGLRSVALFGSVARDEAHSDSDVDVVVEFQEPVTFDRYVGLQFFLEELLECPVDVVTLRSLRPHLRARIEREVVHLPGFCPRL